MMQNDAIPLTGRPPRLLRRAGIVRGVGGFGSCWLGASVC